jgi:putative colanic acid biosynthesis acetyltransferase WcaF
MSEAQPNPNHEQCAPASPAQPGRVDLSRYTTRGFDRGAGVVKEGLWILVSFILFRLCPFSFSSLKCAVLRWFGAQIGRGVTLKPQVKITFPWKLTVGDYVWLGEECWLLNLEPIIIGNHVCVSQRVFLCTGSHNFKSPTFDLITRPIKLADGAWIGAGAWIGPGVTVGTQAVLTAQSVASKDLEANGIHRGNPATLVKPRVIS